jgi:hypothetical protein
LPSIRFGRPSADKNSDLFAVSNDNTALRKSERTMGALIRRTNWVGVPRGCDGTCIAGDRYGSEVNKRPGQCFVRIRVQHPEIWAALRPSLIHQKAHTSDRAQSPIALRRELLASLTTQSIKDQWANVLA